VVAVHPNQTLQLGGQVAIVRHYPLAVGNQLVDRDDQILTEYSMIVR
jgi:hypothetical protein